MFTFFQEQIADQFGLFAFPAQLEYIQLLKVIIYGLLILLILLNFPGYSQKKTIQVQKIISLLYWSMLAVGASFLFLPKWDVQHFLLLGVPVGVLLGLSFSTMSKRWAGFFFFIALVTIIAWQYYPLILY